MFLGGIEVENWLNKCMYKFLLQILCSPFLSNFKFLYLLKLEKTLRLELQLQISIHKKTGTVFNFMNFKTLETSKVVQKTWIRAGLSYLFVETSTVSIHHSKVALSENYMLKVNTEGNIVLESILFA